MSLGTAWGGLMGECTKDMAFELLDAFYELGGNWVDTANSYQGGQSEEWIGVFSFPFIFILFYLFIH
jgi:aryl-alcohol dehydrogenase-like predicted oxidoreductase